MIPPRASRILTAIALFALLGACDRGEQANASTPPEAPQAPTAAPMPNAQPASPQRPAPHEAAPMTTAEAPSDAVSLRRVEATPAPRPPKSFWRVDLTLRNDADAPRWFILPDPIEHPLSKPRTAPGLAVFEAEGVRMVRFSSTQDLLAFLVPASTSLQLDNLKLRCWREDCPDTLDVWSTPSITVSGKPVLSHWLADQTVASSGRADMSSLRKPFKHLNKDFASEPIAFTPDARWSLPLNTPSPWGAADPNPEGVEVIRKAAEQAEPR